VTISSKHFSQLVEIHAAHPWLWPALLLAHRRRPQLVADRRQGPDAPLPGGCAKTESFRFSRTRKAGTAGSDFADTVRIIIR